MEKTFRQYRYETDEKAFPADAYQTDRPDVAWHVLGWELEATEDTEWDGYYQRTGQVLAIMVGDDSVFKFDQDDLSPCEEYCGGCGQIRCNAEVR